RTRSVIIYMETVGNARHFLSAARQVALTKPIIVIKAGRSEAAAKAAASHTGALTGSDDVLDAAFRRSGVLRVQSIADLFHMAEVLATQPRPKGPRLAIVTNAGGPGVLATDSLAAHGGDLASLSQQTIEELNQFLPPHWSHGNPVDVLGDADAERYAKAVEIVSKDRGADGLLVILAPQAMTDPTQTAEKIKRFAKLDGKPILASWMGGASVAAGQAILNHAKIPTFPYPDTAVRTFEYMWRYTYNLRGLYETPVLVADAGDQRAPPSGGYHPGHAPGGPHSAHGVRVEGTPAGVRHPGSRYSGREQRGRGRPACRRDRVSHRNQAALRDHHSQDGRRRRQAQPGGRASRAPCFPRDRIVGRGARRSRTLSRRHRPADGQASGLRNRGRQLGGRPARSRAAVRHRGATGRSLPGPRPGASAPEHHAGAAHDGADPHLPGDEGRPGPEARRP